MQKETLTQSPSEPSLDLLGQQVAAREARIDELRGKTAQAALHTIQEVAAQGKDLLTAKARMSHGQMAEWTGKFFPKSIRTAQRYMAVALKSATVSYLDNPAFQLEMFKAAQIVPEVERVESKDKGLAIAPIFNHLNFVAEWCVKENGAIVEWDEVRRKELKVLLNPVVEIFGKL